MSGMIIPTVMHPSIPSHFLLGVRGDTLKVTWQSLRWLSKKKKNPFHTVHLDMTTNLHHSSGHNRNLNWPRMGQQPRWSLLG